MIKNLKFSNTITSSKRLLQLLLIITILFTNCINAQERKLIYNVIRNGNVIGKINFIELTQGRKMFLSFTSDVKTRFILSFCDHSSETAAYENGVMIYSSFYQKRNGSVKANRLTIADGKSYKLVDKDITRLVSHPPIRYNMLLLYINIPKTVDKVYSDNYQKHLDLKKVDQNKYRLTLPDGNYNYYSYENGVCSNVLIERTLFTIQFVLTENSIKN